MLLSDTSTVLFDFDQTLGKAKSHYGMYVQAANEYNISVTVNDLAQTKLDDAWEKWMTSMGPVHRDASYSETAFAELRREIAADRLQNAGVKCDKTTLDHITNRIVELEGAAENYMIYDDTVTAIEELARRKVQSLIVSNHVWRLPEIVEGLGVSSHFRGVITSARIGVRNPHPAIFEAALELAGSRLDETIVVGDSYMHDIEGARSIMLDSILIDRTNRYQESEIDVPIIQLLTDLVP